MNNPYVDYYVKQAGSGLSGFRGMRRQRGYGIFSSIAKVILPFLKSAGKSAAKQGIKLAKENITADHLKTLGKAGAELALSTLTQSGSGRRRYKRRRRTAKCSKRRRIPRRRAARRRKKRIVRKLKRAPRRRKPKSIRKKKIKCGKRRRRSRKLVDRGSSLDII